MKAKKQCPFCKRFVTQGFKEVWARNQDGKLVIIKLYREVCSRCGIITKENYTKKVNSMELRPY